MIDSSDLDRAVQQWMAVYPPDVNSEQDEAGELIDSLHRALKNERGMHGPKDAAYAAMVKERDFWRDERGPDKRTGQLIAAIIEHKRAIEQEAASDCIDISPTDRKLWSVLLFAEVAGPEAYARENANPAPSGVNGGEEAVISELREIHALLREIRNQGRVPDPGGLGRDPSGFSG